MIRMGRLACLLILVFSVAPSVGAQVSELRAREIAKSVVRVQTQSGETTYFRVRRREDLEDVFCAFHPDGLSGYERDPFFFEISDVGDEFKSGGVISHLSSHRPLIYIVAVSASSGEAYRVSDIKDSRDELNRLAKAYPGELLTEVQAREYAEMYAKLDPILARTDILQTPFQLKQSAEKKFYEVSRDFAEADKLFDQWWNKKGRALSETNLHCSVTQSGRDFTISFYIFSDIAEKRKNEGPRLLRVSLKISEDGQVAEPKFIPAGPNSSP